uniref:Uncharacterized protein n=1 Tax=Rhizophora mucronata TaxID=61149 RepID=A0A2P2NL74_RHIMU
MLITCGTAVELEHWLQQQLPLWCHSYPLETLFATRSFERRISSKSRNRRDG